MAILAVCPTVRGLASVLDASEAQWILDREHLFVTIEFAIRLDMASTSLHVIVHGIVLSGERERRIRRSQQYNALFKISDCQDLEAKDGVYDFTTSFLREGLPSNEGAYEGPAFMGSVKPISEDTVYFRGVEAVVPTNANITVDRVAGKVSCISLKREGNLDFQPSDIYVMRLGFFLAREAYQTETFSRRGDLSLDHHVHLWSLPEDGTPGIANSLRGCAKAADRCRVHITASPFVTQILHEHQSEKATHALLGDMPVSSIDLASVAGYATTDVWIIYPNRAQLTFQPVSVEAIEESAASQYPYGLYPQHGSQHVDALDRREVH
jgi:hypothetical protein